MDIKAFKSEKNHDRLMAILVEDLDRLGKLHVLEKHFVLPPTGGFVKAIKGGPFRYFDVIFIFKNLSVVIETKVDSDEDGRWKDRPNPNRWQTYRIADSANADHRLGHVERFFRFITLGTSEFYTKDDFMPGPANSVFRHVGLETMIALVRDSLQCLPTTKDEYQGWLRALLIEKAKRDHVLEILAPYGLFRDKYLSRAEDIDVPTNRLAFNAPELAFPLFAKLSETWCSKGYGRTLGKFALYPVPRRSPNIHDSVLNLWELWERAEQSKAFTCGGLLPGINAETLYLEINEDYNLNLKLQMNPEIDAGFNETFARGISGYVIDKLAESLTTGTGTEVRGHRRFYKQTNYVLYEWDFGLLSHVKNLGKAADDLAFTVDHVINKLQ